MKSCYNCISQLKEVLVSNKNMGLCLKILFLFFLLVCLSVVSFPFFRLVVLFLSICLSICLSVCLSFHFISPFLSVGRPFSVFMYICLFVCQFVSMLVCLSFTLSVCLSVYLSQGSERQTKPQFPKFYCQKRKMKKYSIIKLFLFFL